MSDFLVAAALFVLITLAYFVVDSEICREEAGWLHAEFIYAPATGCQVKIAGRWISKDKVQQELENK